MMAFFNRFFSLLLRCVAALSISAPAWAQLAVAPQSGLQLTRLEVLHNVPIGLSLTQVLSGQAGAFVEATDLQISHQHWYRAMWLRLHLQATPDAAAASDNAVLYFPKPYLDNLRLYTPVKTAGEPWVMQQAGDFIPPALWPVRSLHPKFLLPSAERVASSEGQSMVLYVQMDHLAPVMLGVNLKDSTTSLEEDALSLLIYGLGLGAILICAVLTAALARIHRDAIYAWYSLYAVAALLACANHAGIAHHILWPVGGYWPGTATLCLLMFSCIGQLQFTRSVYTDHRSLHGLQWLAHGMSAACLLVGVAYPFSSGYWMQMYFAVLTMFAFTSAISLFYMAHGFRSRNKLARIWLMAFVPLGVTVMLALLEGVGILPSTYGSYRLLILAVCLEVLTVGFALQWFAHDRHGQRERQRALASTDPLTGFYTSADFQVELGSYWQQLNNSKGTRSDCSVAYVQLVNKSGTNLSEQQLARFVRVLRSGTRSQDWVGRINAETVALVIPDVGMTEDLDQRLARLIALGLMPDSSDPQASVLQLRIAATTFQSFSGNSRALDAQLMDLLSERKGWGSRPIRYLNAHAKAAAANRAIDNSSLLDEVWAHAVAAEATKATEAPAQRATLSSEPSGRRPSSP
jgi:two-component system, sensor histidine kinase LadS